MKHTEKGTLHKRNASADTSLKCTGAIITTLVNSKPLCAIMIIFVIAAHIGVLSISAWMFPISIAGFVCYIVLRTKIRMKFVYHVGEQNG